MNRDRHVSAIIIGYGLLPFAPPTRRARRHVLALDRRRAARRGVDIGAPDKAERAAVDQVTVEFVDRRVDLAAADERIELAIVEEHLHRAALLVSVIAADHPFAGERIVGRADAR